MGVTIRQKVKGKGRPWTVFVNVKGKRWSKTVGAKHEAMAFAHKIMEGIAYGELTIGGPEKPDEDGGRPWQK
ncbi:MAG: hypothetical protein HY913_00010 [Desulfomonile tiedjei]|nr:hypothetical protein [Desulfomonile tiedjei]